MLRIRLRRIGKRHQPSYRVVVTEHTAPIQGKYLEALGSYNPLATQFSVDTERLQYWLDHGAQPSERIAKLLTHAGVSHKLIVLPDYSKKPVRLPKKAAPVQASAPAAPAEIVATTDNADAASDVISEETSPETPEAAEGGSNPTPTEEAVQTE